jgi:hypothetical protein
MSNPRGNSHTAPARKRKQQPLVEWISAAEPPKETMTTLCQCGVTKDVFSALYRHDLRRWVNDVGQMIVFGNREVEDYWRKL